MMVVVPNFVFLVYVLFKYCDEYGHNGYGDYCTVDVYAYVKSFFLDARAQLSQTLANK